MPGPPYTAHSGYLWFQAQIWSHMTTRRAINQYDNCITSDQNCPKQILFPLLRGGKKGDIGKDCRLWQEVKAREMPLKDLTFAVMLSKAPSEYVKATPQHIKAVRQLEGTRTIKMVGQDILRQGHRQDESKAHREGKNGRDRF